MSLQCPQTDSRSICLLPNTWMGEIPPGSSLALDPTAPTKALLSTEITNKLLLGTNMRVSYSAMTLLSLFPYLFGSPQFLKVCPMLQ